MKSNQIDGEAAVYLHMIAYLVGAFQIITILYASHLSLNYSVYRHIFFSFLSPVKFTV